METKKRDLISISDFSKKEIVNILEQTKKLNIRKNLNSNRWREKRSL